MGDFFCGEWGVMVEVDMVVCLMEGDDGCDISYARITRKKGYGLWRRVRRPIGERYWNGNYKKAKVWQERW